MMIGDQDIDTQRIGCLYAVGLPTVLASGSAGALLRSRDCCGAGVVEQRRLHPEEEDREQSRQQDHEFDRDRTALIPSSVS